MRDYKSVSRTLSYSRSDYSSSSEEDDALIDFEKSFNRINIRKPQEDRHVTEKKIIRMIEKYKWVVIRRNYYFHETLGEFVLFQIGNNKGYVFYLFSDKLDKKREDGKETGRETSDVRSTIYVSSGTTHSPFINSEILRNKLIQILKPGYGLLVTDGYSEVFLYRRNTDVYCEMTLCSLENGDSSGCNIRITPVTNLLKGVDRTSKEPLDYNTLYLLNINSQKINITLNMDRVMNMTQKLSELREKVNIFKEDTISSCTDKSKQISRLLIENHSNKDNLNVLHEKTEEFEIILRKIYSACDHLDTILYVHSNIDSLVNIDL